MHITTKANPVKVNLIIPKPTLPKSILPSQTGQSESCQSYPAKSAKAINYAKANPAKALVVVWSQSSDPGCLPAHSTVLTQGMHCNAVVADTCFTVGLAPSLFPRKILPVPQLIHHTHRQHASIKLTDELSFYTLSLSHRLTFYFRWRNPEKEAHIQVYNRGCSHCRFCWRSQCQVTA